MVFWGAEVKPGEHFAPSDDEDPEYEGSRLHLSQATLGLDGKGKERTVVKCKVGNGSELLLCSLTPGVSESCSLDLLFDQNVVFSVAGSASVHLVGYYIPLDDDEEDDVDYEFDGEEFDFEEDDSEDENSDSDAMDFPPSCVTLTEMDDEVDPPAVPRRLAGENGESPDERTPNGKKKRKREKAEAAKEKEKAEVGAEDDDGFPLTSEEPQPSQACEEPATPSAASKESKKDKKKKKEKEKEKEKASPKVEVVEKSVSEAKSATKVSASNGIETPEKKKAKKAGLGSKKFPNGLEIEDLAMGKPDARQTKPGKKVTVHYTGKLKSTGKIFDSSVGKKPFVFRLGVGEVVKGWDIGVAGMRVGDKRRITVPPAMGYGAKGAGRDIPGNAWLVFDVQVVDVGK